MKALFFIEPLVLHNRPFHYWAWLGHFAAAAGTLRGAGWAIRFAVNEALAVRALAPQLPGERLARRGHGLPAAEIVILEQEPIRALFDRPNSDILAALHRGADPAAYAALVRAALDGFVPDVVFALTPAAQLRAAFPDALVLAAETAAYSRAPFALAGFLDPLGLWDRSVPAVHATALLAREPPPEERALLATFRERFARYFQAVSPFAPLERELRARHEKLALLPLQFGGEPGFDGNAPFRTQGEYLYHVLERLPPEVGLLVVEHPTAHWVGDVIDEETRAHVEMRRPNVRFVDFKAHPSAGQVLLQHVDVAISVSSSIGLQALLFGKPLVAVGTSHLAALASARAVEATATAALDPRAEHALAWLVRHYFMPIELWRRPDWLVPFLERGRARARDGLSFYEPLPDLEELLFGALDDLNAAALHGRVENGDFAAWSRGDGPFWVGEEGPDGWRLLDAGGGVASLGRAGFAAAVARHKVGSGPTLLLTRVPDATTCAGTLARLRFRARSLERATLAAYLYVQVDDGRPGAGTPMRAFALDHEWQTFELVAPVPGLGERTPGPASHVEVVFALVPAAGTTSYQLSDVTLEPVIL